MGNRRIKTEQTQNKVVHIKQNIYVVSKGTSLKSHTHLCLSTMPGVLGETSPISQYSHM